MTRDECEHGSLRRKCPICERDDEISHLNELIAAKDKRIDELTELLDVAEETLFFYAEERQFTKLADPDDEAPPALLDLGAKARDLIRTIQTYRKETFCDSN